jgi:hypothetical protein
MPGGAAFTKMARSKEKILVEEGCNCADGDFGEDEDSGERWHSRSCFDGSGGL